MRDRNIFDLNGAEKWLDSFLLTKRFADSNRLLNTTKLTDLIYSGFQNENIYFDNRLDLNKGIDERNKFDKRILF